MSNIKDSASKNNKISGHTPMEPWKDMVWRIAKMPEVTQLILSTLEPSRAASEEVSFIGYTEKGFTLLLTNGRLSQRVTVVTPYGEAIVDFMHKQRWLSDSENGTSRRTSNGNVRNKGKAKRDEVKGQSSNVARVDDGQSTLADRFSPEMLEQLRQQFPDPDKAPANNDGVSVKSDRQKVRARTEKDTSQRAKAPERDDPRSFAELFGEADDEASFEELLSSSDPDWKKYK